MSMDVTLAEKQKWFTSAVDQQMAYLVIVTNRQTYKTEPRMCKDEEALRRCVDNREGRGTAWVIDAVYDLSKGVHRVGSASIIRDDCVMA